MRRRSRAAVLVVAAVLGAVGLGLAGCDQPRNALGTGASACFPALALAHTAVHREGTLIGVRRANTSRLERRVPEAASLGDATVCIVAYRGQFSAADVDLARGEPSGRYAVVAVDLKHRKVLATFLTNREPVRFRHL